MMAREVEYFTSPAASFLVRDKCVDECDLCAYVILPVFFFLLSRDGVFCGDG